MFGVISNFLAAMGRLTAGVNALADTTEQVNDELRERLQMDETPKLINRIEDVEANGRKARAK